MSTWSEIKQLIINKIPDTGINVVTPKRIRDSMNAIIDQIIASTPDPIEFQWSATEPNGDSKTYEIGEAVIDDNRWFIAIAQNANKKPVLPDGSINTDFWQEENASTTRYIDDWSAKLFTYPVEIVLRGKKLYLLDRAVVGTAPYQSTDIDEEILEDPSPWYDLSPDIGEAYTDTQSRSAQSLIQRTGTVIAFDRPASYGDVTAETGNITFDFTNAISGTAQVLRINTATKPTLPASKNLLSGKFLPSVDNFYYFTAIFISGNTWRVDLTISQTQVY